MDDFGRNRRGGDDRLVGVGEALPSLVGTGQLVQPDGVNPVSGAGKVPGLVVAPELRLRKATDTGQEDLPRFTAGSLADLQPVDFQRAIVSIASFAHKRAGWGAC